MKNRVLEARVDSLLNGRFGDYRNSARVRVVGYQHGTI